MTWRAVLDRLGRLGEYLRQARDAWSGTNDWSAGSRWDAAYAAGYRAGYRAGAADAAPQRYIVGAVWTPEMAACRSCTMDDLGPHPCPAHV